MTTGDRLAEMAQELRLMAAEKTGQYGVQLLDDLAYRAQEAAITWLRIESFEREKAEHDRLKEDLS